MSAAFVCRVPVRVHWFTGQVWAASRGLKRSILKSVDRLIAMLATDPLVDSPSQRDFPASEGIAPRSRLSVLGSGSVRGVDDVRFRPDSAVRASTRQSLGIPKDRTVLVFVGRITRDKGLLELARAMRELRQELPGLHAILVGFEEGDFARELAAELGDAYDRVSIVGYFDTPERFLTATDFMVLPSYREGFGASVIEAASCGLPTIGTRIVRLVDAIVDGETGLIIPPRDTGALMDAMRFLANNPDVPDRMGSAAQHRARCDRPGGSCCAPHQRSSRARPYAWWHPSRSWSARPFRYSTARPGPRRSRLPPLPHETRAVPCRTLGCSATIPLSFATTRSTSLRCAPHHDDVAVRKAKRKRALAQRRAAPTVSNSGRSADHPPVNMIRGALPAR